MRPILPLFVCATLAVTGCARIADSRINPLNWFGRSEAATPVDPTEAIPPLVPETQGLQIVDARGLAGTIVGLSVNRTPDGAIVQATATTTAPGQFNAALVPTSTDAGVLTLAFRVESPVVVQSTQIEPRQITAAYLLSNAELASIRSVRVQGAQNALVSRRR